MDWDQNVVWITTRTIRPGTYEEFRKAWRPSAFPEGMIRAYECFSEDRNEVVGISVWDSFESRERYRLSEVEAERQRAMAPFVEAESSGLYVGASSRSRRPTSDFARSSERNRPTHRACHETATSSRQDDVECLTLDRNKSAPRRPQPGELRPTARASRARAR